MRVRHPYAGEGDGVPPAAVDVHGDAVLVEDGVFEVHDQAWVETFAASHGVDVETILVDDQDADDTAICGAEISDGSTCDRPVDDCPYHDGAE